MNFNYIGNSLLTGNLPVTEPRNFSFNEPLTYLRLDMEGFSAYGVFGKNLGDQQNSYSQFGAEATSGVILVPGYSFNLLLPVKLSTDYVIVRNNALANTGQEFKQNTVGIHSGLDIRVRFSPKVRFNADATAGYSFSVSGFGASGGTATDWKLRNRIYVDRLVKQFGLSFGFDIGSRKYNLDNDDFNYRATQQVVVLGITF